MALKIPLPLSGNVRLVDRLVFDREVVRSTKDALARSRKLLDETAALVDPLLSGRPLKRKPLD